MIKHITLATILIATASQAHAGIWDSITEFFSGDEEKQETTETVAPAQSVEEQESSSTTSSLIKQGVALIPMLTQALGVNTDQAEGGLGALLAAAQAMLSNSDYGTLAKAIPNAQGLLDRAPSLSEAKTSAEKPSLMDSALSAAAEHSDTAKTASQLVNQFKQLGLSADMIPKFTETTQKYLEQNQKSEASDLLSSALGGLF